jgi:hypothetical protein
MGKLQKRNQNKVSSQEKFDEVIQYCDDIKSGKIIACNAIKK